MKKLGARLETARDVKYCPFCEEPFYRRRGQSDRQWKAVRFCSAKHRAYYTKAKAGRAYTCRYHPGMGEGTNMVVGEKPCLYCGKKILRYEKQSDYGWSMLKYCSPACKSRHRKAKRLGVDVGSDK